VANGIIAGTALKRDGVTTAAVDPERATALVAAARQPTSS
jgi:predicted TIM-barrel enzyme